MTKMESDASELGGIREKVLEHAVKKLEVQESVSPVLVEALSKLLQESRPPKASELVQLFEKHFGDVQP